jgi:hypothetical protein
VGAREIYRHTEGIDFLPYFVPEQGDCEALRLAKPCERRVLDGERVSELSFYRDYWKHGFHYFFYFLPIQNVIEKLLELLCCHFLAV